MNGLSRGAPRGALSVLVDQSALNGRGRGILFQAAESISADDVNMMAQHGRGVIGAALTADRAFALGLSPMSDGRQRANAPQYMASVEAKACTETGISAAERALTLRTLAAADCNAADLVSPGHIMPAVVPTQAQVDSRIEVLAYHHAARFNDALAIAWCDILDASGEVADADQCSALAQSLSLPLYIRVGDAAVDYAVFAKSIQPPSIDVSVGGLDLGQFA